MGWLALTVGNIAFTSIAFGALKRQGVLEIHSEKIKNDAFRTAFQTAVGLGEEVTLRAENLFKDLTSK